jgi:hypothetical protein
LSGVALLALIAFVSLGASISFVALLTYRSRRPWITLRTSWTSWTSRARRAGYTRITLVALGSGRSGGPSKQA